MVSSPHEVPLEILRDEPALLAQLLRALGIGDGPGTFAVADATLWQGWWNSGGGR